MKAEGKYKFTPRGENFIKGKGMMHTHFLTANDTTEIGMVPLEAFEKKSSTTTAPPSDQLKKSDEKIIPDKQQNAKISVGSNASQEMKQSKTCILS